MSTYSYTPLNESAQEIRLMTLLPGRFGMNIHIKLSVAVLTKASTPHYEALSYAWGTTDDPSCIFVGLSDDHVLKVTQNLESALQHLRLEDRPRVLWIDAICVNQDDLEERGSQVQRMADIYPLAERVVVWLGPTEDDSDSAIKLLDTLSNKIAVDWQILEMRPSISAQQLQELHWADPRSRLPYTSYEFQVICILLKRSWFERLWVQQEIRLAKSNAVVVCGFKHILWQRFRDAIFCLNGKKLRQVLEDKHRPFRDRIRLLYGTLQWHGNSSLHWLIRQTQDCKCIDPRDRVYAVLSLQGERYRDINLKPSYSKSVVEVYQDTVLSYIEHFKSIDILESCELFEWDLERPSWVPDWSVKKTTHLVPWSRAAQDFDAEAAYLDPRILRLTGVQLGTISDAEDIIFVNNSYAEVVNTIRRHVPSDIARDQQKLEEYCRTLCYDKFRDWYDPMPSAYVTLEKSLEVLKLCVDPLKPTDNVAQLEKDHELYLDEVYNCADGHSFLKTEAGHIGLGPKRARLGDLVVVFLGCSTLLVLRPTMSGRFHVVGACYIINFMKCEGLLGPLHEGYEFVWTLDRDGLGEYRPSYKNRVTGEKTWVDPRWSRLNPYLQHPKLLDEYHANRGADEKIGDPRLTSQCLKAAGVDIRSFDLV